MSCDTLNQGSTGLQVSMAQLPEGFCPTSIQEMANAIAERLIVSPNQAFTSFAVGSTEPSSNVGPWLRNCLQWFFFDDATARYVPQAKGGFDTMQYFITSGVFVVPDLIYKLKITAFGGGGAGFPSAGATSTSGGGGGACGISIVAVTPGQSIPYSVGIGGVAGANGGDTTILTLTAGGGKGAPLTGEAGLGGTATGFAINLTGQSGTANYNGTGAVKDTPGGDAGGWGGKGGVARANAVTTGRSGTAPGGGGSGGTSGGDTSAGSGAAGAILIEY